MLLADEEATSTFAHRLAAQLQPGMIIYLRGELGAGKTSLVRYTLKELGYKGRVKSPTYTLVEHYHIAGLDLRHFDLYRLNNTEEWDSAGFREEIDGSNIILVEWPEKAQASIPHADLEISFKILLQGREIEILANTETGKQCLEQL